MAEGMLAGRKCVSQDLVQLRFKHIQSTSDLSHVLKRHLPKRHTQSYGAAVVRRGNDRLLSQRLPHALRVLLGRKVWPDSDYSARKRCVGLVGSPRGIVEPVANYPSIHSYHVPRVGCLLSLGRIHQGARGRNQGGDVCRFTERRKLG